MTRRNYHGRKQDAYHPSYDAYAAYNPPRKPTKKDRASTADVTRALENIGSTDAETHNLTILETILGIRKK